MRRFYIGPFFSSLAACLFYLAPLLLAETMALQTLSAEVHENTKNIAIIQGVGATATVALVFVVVVFANMLRGIAQHTAQIGRLEGKIDRLNGKRDGP